MRQSKVPIESTPEMSPQGDDDKIPTTSIENESGRIDSPPSDVNLAAVAAAQRDLLEHLCRLVAKKWIDEHSGREQKTTILPPLTS